MWSGVRSLVSTQGRRGKGTSIALVIYSFEEIYIGIYYRLRYSLS